MGVGENPNKVTEVTNALVLCIYLSIQKSIDEIGQKYRPAIYGPFPRFVFASPVRRRALCAAVWRWKFRHGE